MCTNCFPHLSVLGHLNLSSFKTNRIAASAERKGDTGVESYKDVQELARWRGEEEYGSKYASVSGNDSTGTWLCMAQFAQLLRKLFIKEGS